MSMVGLRCSRNNCFWDVITQAYPLSLGTYSPPLVYISSSHIYYSHTHTTHASAACVMCTDGATYHFPVGQKKVAGV